MSLTTKQIVIAALGPVMLRCAAQYADVWNTLSFSQSFEEQLEETRLGTPHQKGLARRSGALPLWWAHASHLVGLFSRTR